LEYFKTTRKTAFQKFIVVIKETEVFAI